MNEITINKLYAYVMTYDTGFAPNPFYGVCTLACCKPKIRSSVANSLGKIIKEQNDEIRQSEIRKKNIWIAGFAGKDLKAKSENISLKENYLVYLMQVTDCITIEEYSNNPDFQSKIPGDEKFFTMNEDTDDFPCQNVLKENCGDNIYIFDEENRTIRQRPSFHQIGGKLNVDTMTRDLSGKYVLLSDHFIYFGAALQKVDFNIKGGPWHSVYDEKNKYEEMKEFEKEINSLNLVFSNKPLERPINSSDKFNRE